MHGRAQGTDQRLSGQGNGQHVAVERQNLIMRMGTRRVTHLSNGFSKKLENHLHMLPL